MTVVGGGTRRSQHYIMDAKRDGNRFSSTVGRIFIDFCL